MHVDVEASEAWLRLVRRKLGKREEVKKGKEGDDIPIAKIVGQVKANLPKAGG